MVSKGFFIWPKRELFLTGPTREIPSGQNGPILAARAASQNARFASSFPLADSVTHIVNDLFAIVMGVAQINFHQRQVISIYCTNSTVPPLSSPGDEVGGGREFEVARVAPESEKQMQIGQVLPLIFIPYTYLGSKKKPLAFILAFKKSVIFLKSGRKSCSEKLLQLRLLK